MSFLGISQPGFNAKIPPTPPSNPVHVEHYTRILNDLLVTVPYVTCHGVHYYMCVVLVRAYFKPVNGSQLYMYILINGLIH